LINSGNLFTGVARKLIEEQVTVVADEGGTKIERIVSTGQASPPGFWYDQDWTEWVLIISGMAGLLFDGEEAPRILGPGDYVEIPPHLLHRVEWTDADQPTIWLAVHIKGPSRR
jgi:cupin 2 domain-containing protein